MGAAFARTALLLALGASTASCGPERDLSGVWRLDACDDRRICPAKASAPEDAFVYELHLGRFGDGVAGLLVQYAWRGEQLDSFDKPNECGCFFLSSGRADGSTLHFELPEGRPRGCSANGDRPAPGCEADSPVLGATCDDVLFDLEGDDELLTGTITCRKDADDADDGASGARRYSVRFVSESGRPRTSCVDCGGE